MQRCTIFIVDANFATIFFVEYKTLTFENKKSRKQVGE
jgi:hypothetical protein